MSEHTTSEKRRSDATEIARSAAALAVLLLAAVAPAQEGPASAPVTEPPPAADLRPAFRKFGLEPRSQGPRGTCSIFTTCTAIEFALAKVRGPGARLSPEFLNWAAGEVAGRPSDGNFFHNAIDGFRRFGICAERVMPYSRSFDAKAAPAPEALTEARGLLAAEGTRLEIRWIVPWKPNRFGIDDATFHGILRILARGWPVAAGSSHSRLIVGYRADPAADGGGAFLTLDSALARFAEVSFAYLREKLADAFWVEALPAAETRPLPGR